MIDEHLQETACLHVLGLLEGDEAVAFEREFAARGELRDLVRSLTEASVALAQGAPVVAAPEGLRKRLLASVAEGSKLAPFPPAAASRPRWPLALSWAAAAGMAAVAWWQWTQTSDARRQAEMAQQETSVLRSSAEQSALKANLLETNLKTASQEAQVLRDTTAAITSDAQTLRDKLSEAEKSLAALGAERTGLLTRVADLEKTNSLDQARIAVLGSLIKDRPKAVAVSVWNQQRQDGILVVENLPVLARGRDYQLWVLDPEAGAPVSAGVFKVDAQGKVRILFKPDKPIKQADKFAITEEKEGGAPAPTMTKMVVVGG